MNQEGKVIYHLIDQSHLNPTEKFFAGLLDLKPVLRFRDGEFSRLDVGRKTENTLDALVDAVKKQTHGKHVRAYGLYSGNRDLYEQLAQKLLRDRKSVV